MWQAECRTPEKIQDVLDKGCSAVKEIRSLHEQHQELTVKVDNHVQKLQPLVERLSGLITQIAEVERFRAYVSWIQKIKSVRYSNYKKFANASNTHILKSIAVERPHLLKMLTFILFQLSSTCHDYLP